MSDKAKKFELIEGQGRNLKDTRPSAARLGRHTLPDVIVAIRRFVAEHGFVPPEVQAELDAASRPITTAPEENKRALPWMIGVVGLVVLMAGVLFFALRPSIDPQPSFLRGSAVVPPPLPPAAAVTVPAALSTTAALPAPSLPSSIDPPKAPVATPRVRQKPLQVRPPAAPAPALSSTSQAPEVSPGVPTVKRLPMDI